MGRIAHGRSAGQVRRCADDSLTIPRYVTASRPRARAQDGPRRTGSPRCNHRRRADADPRMTRPTAAQRIGTHDNSDDSALRVHRHLRHSPMAYGAITRVRCSNGSKDRLSSDPVRHEQQQPYLRPPQATPSQDLRARRSPATGQRERRRAREQGVGDEGRVEQPHAPPYAARARSYRTADGEHCPQTRASPSVTITS